MIQSNIILINFLLTLPIISCIYTYYKNYNFKKKILFAEAYFGLNVLCYCAYLLIHYRIHHSYNEVPEGERIALFGSSGFLEIAINKGVKGSGGGASQLFGITINDIISLEFGE